MKKSKLLISIMSLCFALAVLTFGVFAAQQVNYSVNGTICYQVQDAYVQIQTYLYKYGDHSSTTAPDLLSASDLETKAGQWSNVTYPSAGSIGTTHLTQLNAANGSQSLYYNTETNPPAGGGAISQDIYPTLAFNTTDAKAYFIVIHIKNLGVNTIHAGLSGAKFYTLDVNEDEVVADSSNLILYSTDMFSSISGSSNTTNIVLGITLDKKSVNVSEMKFRFNVEIGNGEYTDTLQYSMNKGYYVNMGYYTISETQYPVSWKLCKVVDNGSNVVDLGGIEKFSDLSNKKGTFVQSIGIGVSRIFNPNQKHASNNYADDYYESELRAYLINEDANATASTSYLKALGITASDPIYSAIVARSLIDLYSDIGSSSNDYANITGHMLPDNASSLTDKLWLLSMSEAPMVGATYNARKYYNTNSNTAVIWWLRSCSYTENQVFTAFGSPDPYNPNGSIYYHYSSENEAVRAAFNLAL